ncbi:hypothetical protein [Flagellimonas lutimaris]|uniref:hypothetical protein n=1 Tax=Flagellimonas lutimaris TaxID=475082 RepID=UPI0039C1B9AE
MTDKEFIKKIQAVSKESKNLIYGDGGFNIRRGMAHSISGNVEDLFALFIASKIGRKELTYYVDKVISFRKHKKAKATSFKPDLMIINSNNVMTHYFDVKTNLGWNRHLKDYVIKKHVFIEKLKERNSAWITLKNEKAINVSVSDKLKYHMVVVYGGNINSRTMADNRKIVAELDNVNLDVLFHDEETDSFELDQGAFSNIHNSIINNI